MHKSEKRCEVELGNRSSQPRVTSPHRPVGAVTGGIIKDVRSRSNVRDRRDKILGLSRVTAGVFPVPSTASVDKTSPGIVFKLGCVNIIQPVDCGAPSQDFAPWLVYHPIVHVYLRIRHVVPIVGGSKERLRKRVSRNI